MSRFVTYSIFAALLMAVLAGCVQKNLPDSGKDNTANVKLAMKVGNVSVPTRSGETLKGEFNGMTAIRLVPFSVRNRAISGSDTGLGYPIFLPDISSASGLLANSGAHLFSGSGVNIPVGCASVLAYGRSIPSVVGSDQESKHANGSVVESGLALSSSHPEVSAIGFSPDPILATDSGQTEGVPTEANTIATLLNSLFHGVYYQQTVYYGENRNTEYILTVDWNENIDDARLRDYFNWITNEGNIMSGSGAGIQYMLNVMFRNLLGYSNYNDEPCEIAIQNEIWTLYTESGGNTPLKWSAVYNQICDDLLNRFRNSSVLDCDEANKTVTFKNVRASHTIGNYPESYGLPYGSSALRWTSTGFVVSAGGGVDGTAPLGRFCYPPALYYYANTAISTSEDETVQSLYTDSSASWEAILDGYEGHVVAHSTRSAALNEPLQYAVGMMRFTVQASKQNLQDDDGDEYTTYPANFPVTGIIIGQQYRQKYDFTPDNSGDEYYLYDNRVSTSGITLTKDKSDEFRTLVFQTPIDKTVYFCLELLNDSDNTFYGVEGKVLPHHYFYLTGKLDPYKDGFPQVFLQDHYTTVECVVNSLENAHVTIPDLSSTQLALGVQTKINWDMSYPTTVVLE